MCKLMKFLILLLLQLFTLVAADVSDTSKLTPKIVGGTATIIEQMPYQVSVRLRAREKRSYGSGHICGGTLISQRLISTAAHCMVNSETNSLSYRYAREFVLVMGSTYLTHSSGDTLQFNVQQIIVHERYNHSSLYNDIALMFFNGFVPWESKMARALAIRSAQVPTGTQCIVSGWGSVGDGQKTNTLRMANVPIVSYKECFIGYVYIPKSQLCAGYMSGGADACQGDSGGPLACNGTLVGIVSWGIGCGVQNHPGIYTNVSYYSGWIEQQNATLNYSLYRDAGVSLAPHTAYWLWLGIIAFMTKILM